MTKQYNFWRYLRSNENYWFWLVIGISVGTVIAISLISESSSLAPLRWTVGSVFLFILPGYCFFLILYPSRKLDLEMMVLSVALSPALILIDALLINFIAGGMPFALIVASLSMINVLLGILALLRKYSQVQKVVEQQ